MEQLINDDDDLEVYDTLDVLKDEEQGIESDEKEAVQYPNLTIKIDKDQYSVYEMKRKFDKAKICMDPSFQRNFVWSTKQKSELIESVIMGIPLPLIYFAESQSGELIVVDGRQRLTTFFDFLNNKFRLGKLKILTELNGNNFADLERQYEKYASAIEDFQLVVQIIKYPTPDRVRFDIFDRVNRGGTPLNKQEMRNALYQGNATELLKRVAESESFMNATDKSISSKHMKDRYIVLRAIAFTLLREKILLDSKGEVLEYKSDLEDLLGKTMEYLNQLSEEKIGELQAQFERIMDVIHNVLDKDAFRIGNRKVSQQGTTRRRPISMTLFESLYYLFYLLNRQYSKEVCMSMSSVIRDKVLEMMQNKKFLNSLQKSVDSSYSVDIRFDTVMVCYRELIGDVK